MESYLRRLGEWRRGATNFFGNNRRNFKPTPPSVIDLSRLRQAQQPRSLLQQPLLSRRRGSFFRDKATSARSGVQEATANCCLTARGLYSQSTVPGFIQMAQARNPFRIIIWFVAFVGLGSVALSNLYELMHEYFQYPLTVNIRLEDVYNVEFPAVTLCNLNPVRKSLLCGQETDLDYTLQEFLCNKTAEMTVTRGEDEGQLEQFVMWLATKQRTEPELARTLGHQLPDLLRTCSIQGIKCDLDRMFTLVFSSRYGNCFCFHCNSNNEPVFRYRRLGRPEQGLELLIAVEQYEYLPITPEAGYMVMIHKQGHDPEEATDGIFVAPGQTTYVGVTMNSIYRLKAPYPSNCVPTWPSNSLQPNASLGKVYSRALCLKLCQQGAVLKNCSCESSFMPAPSYNSYNVCDVLNNNETLYCVDRVRRHYELGQLECNCPQACVETLFLKSTSIAAWAKDVGGTSHANRQRTRTRSSVPAKVVIYFQSLTAQNIRQVAQYSPSNLVSNMGGILGMYVSFSFLVIFEIFEVIARSVLSALRVWRSRNRQQAPASGGTWWKAEKPPAAAITVPETFYASRGVPIFQRPSLSLYQGSGNNRWR
nr:acid-sensing ion channel 2-like [Rhipicephalus microplus]